MTVQEFMDNIERYYGKYERVFLREDIKGFVEDNYSEAELPILLENIKTTFSTQYKTQPDIAIIESVKREYNKEHGQYYRYANGTVEYLGKGIGLTAPKRDGGNLLGDICRAIAETKKITGGAGISGQGESAGNL